MTIYEFGYDPQTNRITRNKITEENRLKIKVERTLLTEREMYPIYDSQYGVELEQFKGMPIQFYLSHLEKTIRDALLIHEEIQDVVNFEFTQERNQLKCEFTVQSIYGTFPAHYQEEKEI